jgi:hypothetical protein
MPGTIVDRRGVLNWRRRRHRVADNIRLDSPLKLDDNLSQNARFNKGMRGTDVLDGKMLLTEKRPQLSSLRKRCGLEEYPSVMRATFAGEQEKEGEHAGVGGAAKRERGEGVRSPPKAAYDMAGIALHRDEGRIQRCAADGVIDNVKALARGIRRHILLDR